MQDPCFSSTATRARSHHGSPAGSRRIHAAMSLAGAMLIAPSVAGFGLVAMSPPASAVSTAHVMLDSVEDPSRADTNAGQRADAVHEGADASQSETDSEPGGDDEAGADAPPAEVDIRSDVAADAAGSTADDRASGTGSSASAVVSSSADASSASDGSSTSEGSSNPDSSSNSDVTSGSDESAGSDASARSDASVEATGSTAADTADSAAATTGGVSPEADGVESDAHLHGSLPDESEASDSAASSTDPDADAGGSDEDAGPSSQANPSIGSDADATEEAAEGSIPSETTPPTGIYGTGGQTVAMPAADAAVTVVPPLSREKTERDRRVPSAPAQAITQTSLQRAERIVEEQPGGEFAEAHAGRRAVDGARSNAVVLLSGMGVLGMLLLSLGVVVLRRRRLADVSEMAHHRRGTHLSPQSMDAGSCARSAARAVERGVLREGVPPARRSSDRGPMDSLLRSRSPGPGFRSPSTRPRRRSGAARARPNWCAAACCTMSARRSIRWRSLPGSSAHSSWNVAWNSVFQRPRTRTPWRVRSHLEVGRRSHIARLNVRQKNSGGTVRRTPGSTARFSTGLARS